MSGHTYRKGYNIDPFAEWVRRDLPGSKDGKGSGIVRADLDTAFRRYGPTYSLGAGGDLMLIEQKAGDEDVTYGEAYLYRWLDTAIMGTAPGPWRGNHVLRIHYASYPSECASCGRPIETADEAYARFVAARLEWDAAAITHDDLKALLLGIEMSEQRPIFPEGG